MNPLEPTPDEIAALLQVEHLLDQRWPETKIEPSTTRIAALMELLGSPQRAYPSIHVAGTNGKTSVTRLIDALLTALHRRTGRDHQPAPAVRGRAHLDRRQAASPRRSTSRPIARSNRSSRWSTRSPRQALPAGGPRMSKFEVVTAMAFAAFADAPVDVAVVEVGLGGRWDATNVDRRARRGDHPDRHRPRRLPWRHHRRDRRGEGRHHHQAAGRPGADGHRRGDRAADARGHGGVAGAGASGPTPRWPARTPSSRCCAARSPSAGSCSNFRGSAGSTPTSSCRCTVSIRRTTRCVALAAVEAFFGAGADRQLDVDAVRAGFATVASPGRLERMRSAPTVFIDAAHNPAGAAALADGVADRVRLPLPVGRRLGDGRQGRRRHPRRTRARVRPDRGAPTTGRPARWTSRSWPCAPRNASVRSA